MSGPQPVIVVGGDDLALQTIMALTEHYRVPVSAVVTSGRRTDQILALTGIRAFATQRVDEQALRRAGIEQASAIALLELDDAANLQAALVAQEVHPDIRTVIRSFNVGLASRVRLLLNDAVVLSDSDIAATAWVEDALLESVPEPIHVGGSQLWVCWHEEVSEEAVVAGLVAMSGGLLSGNGSPPVWVLAAERPRQRPRGDVYRRPSRALRLGQALRSVRRSYYVILAVLAVMFVVSSMLLASFDNTSIGAAFVSVLLITVGQAFFDRDAPSAVQAIQITLAIVSVAFVPTLAAAVVDIVVSSRLSSAQGRNQKLTNHIVLVGLGNLGTQILRRLELRGISVTAVERQAEGRGVDTARERGIGVVVGDATQPAVLTLAQARTASTVLVTIPDDFTNLEVALTVREVAPRAMVFLRLRDNDFARRLSSAFNFDHSMDPAAIAAPAFAHAMVCHEPVLRVLDFGRRILIVGAVRVEPDSALSGALLSSVDASNLIRLFGIEPPGAAAIFTPPDRRIEPDTRLLVVCTQAGLADLLGRARSPYT